LKYARPYSYFSRGLYADQLGPFFAYFPRTQIHCIFYDSIVKEPAVVAMNTQDFLGIDARPEDAIGLEAVNAAPLEGGGIQISCFEMLNDRYSEPNIRLAGLLELDCVPWQ